MKFKAKYDNKITKITTGHTAKKRRLMQKLSADFERKANQLAPRDEGDLMESAQPEFYDNSFELQYYAPYALKVYRGVGIKIKTGVNPNARPYWTDEAWKRNKEAYLKQWKQIFNTKN